MYVCMYVCITNYMDMILSGLIENVKNINNGYFIGKIIWCRLR